MMKLNVLKRWASVAGVVVAGLALANGVQAQGGDPAARGKVLFLQCAACHAFQPGAGAKVGPNLSGVVGRKAASVPGFHYSPALAKSGLVWNEATLEKWLTGPQRLVPGTTMMFPGLQKPEDRKAIIAYLRKGK